MANYLLGKVEDFKDGAGVAVKAGKRVIAVFRVDDAFYAFNNTCPHKGGNLCDGEVWKERMVLRCPWHNWAWGLADGRLMTDPREAVRTYDIAVVEGQVVLTA